jgi:hypothetical protein
MGRITLSDNSRNILPITRLAVKKSWEEILVLSLCSNTCPSAMGEIKQREFHIQQAKTICVISSCGHWIWFLMVKVVFTNAYLRLACHL